jgi:hypothetical protein
MLKTTSNIANKNIFPYEILRYCDCQGQASAGATIDKSHGSRPKFACDAHGKRSPNICKERKASAARADEPAAPANSTLAALCL